MTDSERYEQMYDEIVDLKNTIKRKNAEIEKLKENNKYLDDCLKVVYGLVGEMVGG